MTYLTIISIAKIFIALFIVAFFFCRLFRERQKSIKPPTNYKNVGYWKYKLTFLIILAILSVGCFFNLGVFHGTKFYQSRYTHHWEMFHYYLGSKYFKELGYFNLYNATVVADAEGNNYIESGAEITNLENYLLTSKEKILKNAVRYKSLFSQQRWEDFRSDVKSFQDHFTPKIFTRMLKDHGYNATPVWNATVGALTSIIPAQKIILLAFLDIFLLMIVFWVIGRVYDIETMLVSLIFFSVNFLSSFYWIGGCYLRYGWLACSVIALCMIHKGNYKTAGVLISFATAVRLFPAFLLVGVIIKTCWSIIGRRKIPKKYLHLLISFILASTIFLMYGCLPDKSMDSWKDFAQKIKLHNKMLLTNNVGLRSVILYDRSWSDFNEFVNVYGGSGDHFINWRNIKSAELNEVKGDFLTLSMLVLLLLFFILKNKNDEESFAWGIVMVFMLLMLTCYYYSFLIMFVMIFYKRKVNLINTLHLSLLFITQIAGHMINFYDNFWLSIYFRLSVVMLIYFSYLIISEMFMQLHYKKSIQKP